MKKLEKALYITCIATFGLGAVASAVAGNWSAATYAVTSVSWCLVAFKFRTELN